MMKRLKNYMIGSMAAVVACCLFLSLKTEERFRVFMIGDSTMANKQYEKTPERGWGMVLQCFFDDEVVIDNHAVNGRSSKSFIAEGRWQKVIDQVKPGDYVVIQFGHNDEKPQPERHTDPGTTFDANLRRFVVETREKGGIPILMNAVVRRNFVVEKVKNDDDEKLRLIDAQAKNDVIEDDTLRDTHGKYLDSPRDVAKEQGCVFIDANRITHELEQSLGREASKKLHMWYEPGDTSLIPNGRRDNTHYNIYGAHVVARLLAKAMGHEVKQLRRHLVNYDMAVSKNGQGDYFTIEEALAAIPEGKKTTIQILGGEWQRPVVPKAKKVKFVLRNGAKWKK